MRCGNLHGVLLTVVLLVLGIAPLRAQLNYFVYIESENREPFYIRLQNKIHPAPNGHLILSKLPEGDIKLELGFPQSTAPEQQFNLTIGKNDRGFLLRNFSDKGWVLYDLQQSQLIAAAPRQTQPAAKQKDPLTAPVVNDPFANMLSVVTQDSTVKQVTVQKDPPPADTLRQPVPRPAVTGNIAQNKQPVTPASQAVVPPSNPAAVAQPVVLPQTEPAAVTVTEVVTQSLWVAPEKSLVQLINRFESSAGFDLVFRVTEAGGSVDTVKLFVEGMPVAQQQTAPANEIIVPLQVPETDTLRAVVMPAKDTVQPVIVDTLIVAQIPAGDTVRTQAPVVPEVKPEEKTQVKTVPEEEQKAEAQAQQPVVQLQPAPASIPNSNCRQQATEDDFVKLRRRLAQQKRDEDMVQEARKQFQQRCFTTVQIRMLGMLLLTDEWRYRLYDAALPFVSDFSNFSQLAATIESDYYRKRFLALLPNN